MSTIYNLLEQAAVTEIVQRDFEPDELAAAQVSAAISLKRIADFLTQPGAAEERIRQLSLQPVNVYGEGLAEAIQNGIERGLRGISTNG